MTRDQFLKLTGTLTLGAALPSMTGCGPTPGPKTHNWAGNIEYSTTDLRAPATLDDLPALVKELEHVKAQGTCHCFNRIADSKDVLLSTRQFNKATSIDKEKNTVTVEAGIKYGELAPWLHQQGYALHNLASLPHISVAGSVSTATHGSGVENGNLSTAVEGVEFIDAKGNKITLSREKDGDKFLGAVVALGALGVFTHMTLRVHPTFQARQWVFEKLPLDQLYANFEGIMSAGYSVSLFTDWQADSVNEVWVKSKADMIQPAPDGKTFFGATPATRDMHPIAANDAVNCTPQMGVPGPWYERLPHFKMGFTPSSGVELQSEYFVPFEQGVEAMKAVATLAKEIGPHLFISEIRSIAADDLWMSMAYKRKSIAIHCTWKQETDAVMALLPKIEKVLEPFAPRPHSGKLFTLPPQVLESRYERMKDFRELAKEYDPDGKFVNEFLKANIFG
jgi:xylitol oxidase